MILSAELFKQIIDALRSDSRDDRERRTAPRVGLRAQAEVLLRPGSGTPAVLMRVRDLSATGIGLVHTELVPAGSEFVVRLPGGLDGSVHVSCAVAHCRRAATDTFMIGGRIIRVLAPEEAATLGGARK